MDKRDEAGRIRCGGVTALCDAVAANRVTWREIGWTRRLAAYLCERCTGVVTDSPGRTGVRVRKLGGAR